MRLPDIRIQPLIIWASFVRSRTSGFTVEQFYCDFTIKPRAKIIGAIHETIMPSNVWNQVLVITCRPLKTMIWVVAMDVSNNKIVIVSAWIYTASLDLFLKYNAQTARCWHPTQATVIIIPWKSPCGLRSLSNYWWISSIIDNKMNSLTYINIPTPISLSKFTLQPSPSNPHFIF